MGLGRDDLRRLELWLRPLRNRVANIVARGVVRMAHDTTKLQNLQLRVLAGESIDEAEHHQPYGFSSVPLAGAEVVVLFQNGDRARPIVVAASDRRHRPTGGESGQVTMYHHTGTVVTMLEDGTIEARSRDGVALPLATKADVEALRAYVSAQFASTGGHTHAVSGAATTAIVTVPAVPDPLPAPQPVPPTVPPPTPTGTTVLKAE
jgi:phage baseplate assembly protein V